MPLLIRSKVRRHKNRGAWQQVGLVAGFLAGRHFVGAKDLHYGYWVDGLEPIIRNLPRAQEEYCRFLLAHIPADANSILDVGCGAGGVAASLLARGHRVECVSPSEFLNSQAKQLLGDRVRINECKYEDFHTSEVYDVVLFCESFQYVKMEVALANAVSQLRSGGQLIISDFFRLPGDKKSPISGGHRLEEFQEIIARFPFKLVEEKDISTRTSPTFTVIESAFSEVLQPIWNEIDVAGMATFPRLYRFGNWLFRRRLEKVKQKYFTHERSAENFERYKTYRLMRFVRA
ncbi:MAG: class I SAM-dependent methyltransferase [Pirellulales bacterium]|nr:class I SAM-dependent methyltransferase [Pirellulales bacterium]